jgi:hypothetical protein
MMKVCEQMQLLRQLLDKKNIPWEDHSEDMTRDKDSPMWFCRTWFEYKGTKWSVVNGFGTYGGWFGANPGASEKENMGLLELYDWISEPKGWLTANDVMKEIEK